MLKIRLIPMLLLATGLIQAHTCDAQVRVQVEAFAGAPFGVGRVTLSSGGEFRLNPPQLSRAAGPRGGRIAGLARKLLDQPTDDQAVNLESAEMSVVEKSGRVFYPVFEKRDRPILRQFVSVPSQATIYFLFQGSAPLDLTIFAPGPDVERIVPARDPAGHQRMLLLWWNNFSSAAVAGSGSSEYPPMVEGYLTDSLARRLSLPMPQRPARRELSLFRSEMNLLFETETARLDMAQAILSGDVPNPPATETLAQELPPPKPEVLNLPADVAIEPLAMHVPVECMYIRFGTFPNILWLRHRMEDWGGELRDIITERGLETGDSARLQKQLCLRQNALAELFGEKVVSDVALIGTDPLLHEGAAMGTLFQAKNSTLMAADLTQQRVAAMKEAENAKEEKLDIGGRQVSLISTPDNSLRSFYVADGDFHLVTTSRTMVEWFLSTAAGKHESIGASDEFRLARAKMPITRNDTVFVYLSPEFFQNLMSAEYQIEINRRLRSTVEMDLVQIAQLAARSEGQPGATVDELVASGYLPEGFGVRPDGSRLEFVDGKPIDSLRGRRGTFAPVLDVGVGKVTRGEAVEYQRVAKAYSNELGPMDPIVVGIQRQALPEGGLERVLIDLKAAPLSEQHIQMLAKWLGPPTIERLAPVPGDVVGFEAVLRGGTFFAGDEHHLFGALRDADPTMAADPRAGLLARLVSSKLEGLNGYIGAWPNVGYLKFIGGASNIPADAAGYSQLWTGFWRRQGDGFTLLSFHPEVLADVSPQLQFVKADRPAQIWFHADDLANSKLAPMLNAYGYRQSRQTSLGNTRYMNMLSEQLHVPPADARKTAEQLLWAKLVPMLDGEYELRELPGGHATWVLTSLADRPNSTEMPADYQFRALNWLRGIQFELVTENGQLAAHAEVIMPVETRPAAGFQFPSLPFGAAKPGPTPAQPKSKTAPKPNSKPAPSNGSKSSGAREF